MRGRTSPELLEGLYKLYDAPLVDRWRSRAMRALRASPHRRHLEVLSAIREGATAAQITATVKLKGTHVNNVLRDLQRRGLIQVLDAATTVRGRIEA